MHEKVSKIDTDDIGGNDEKETKTKPMQYVGSLDKTLVVGNASYLNKNTVTIDGVKYYAQKRTDNKGNSLTTWYYPISKVTDVMYDGGRSRGKGFKAGTPYYRYYGGGSSRKKDKVTPNKDKVALYAKGTTGTQKDQWAITDESWIGEEITLAAGKNGQLQYLKKGSAVMPADISANLIEWGKLNPNMMNMPNAGGDVNIINNAVNKPELNLSFDSLVHVDNCSQDTLKDLEKMVDTKINQFSRNLNYALKRVGGK